MGVACGCIRKVQRGRESAIKSVHYSLYGVIKFGVTPEVFAMASCIFAVSFLSATVISKLAGIRHMSH
jgi:hypothetical protein